MGKVYVWATYRGVHLYPDCPALANGNAVKTEINEVGLKSPCRTCFKEVRGVLHTVCKVCNPLRVRPCMHNGGVQVRITPPNRPPMLVWTWPERALFVPVVGYGSVSVSGSGMRG